MPRIGMTEAGDAGWDFQWFTKLTQFDFAGAILITKAVSRPQFMQKALELYGIKPFIIHAGITGWGGTPMEPNVADYRTSLNAVRSLIDSGIPARNFVLRIDPIYPTPEGIQRAVDVVNAASEIIPDVTRIRISIYDDYHNARHEIANRGLPLVDDNPKWKNEMERRPTPAQVTAVATALIAARPDLVYEVCAEPEIASAYKDHFIWHGCLSHKDCDIMGITVPAGTGINGQNRFGCRCLKLKTELLDKKRRCPNNCAYCYWGRN